MKTTHLSESEFVDLVEDVLDPCRAAHADACASCREQADALRAMLRDTRGVAAPEPSPLFWEHFPVRVRAQVSAEPVAGRAAWIATVLRGLLPLAAAAALVVAVWSGVLLLRAGRPGATQIADRVASEPAASATVGTDTATDAENAEVWAVLTAAASTMEFEDAHDAGMHVQPAAIERAVQDLTAAERTELGRLLQTELKRSSN